MNRFFLFPILALIGAGCVATTPMQEPSSDHPAALNAPSSAMPEPSQVLSNPEPVQANAQGGGHGDHGSMSAATRTQPATRPTQQAAAAYVCPMHPEVTSNEPAKCPKCFMKLVKSDSNSGGHDGH